MYFVGREIYLDSAVQVHFCHSKWCEGEIKVYRVFMYPVMTINSKAKKYVYVSTI